MTKTEYTTEEQEAERVMHEATSQAIREFEEASAPIKADYSKAMRPLVTARWKAIETAYQECMAAVGEPAKPWTPAEMAVKVEQEVSP